MPNFFVAAPKEKEFKDCTQNEENKEAFWKKWIPSETLQLHMGSLTSLRKIPSQVNPLVYEPAGRVLQFG